MGCEIDGMPVTVLCPNLRCRAKLCVPDRVRGKRVRCPQCSITFQIPDAPAPKKPAPGPNTPATSPAQEMRAAPKPQQT